ncbi:hypothetical protein K7X08_016090 [Anisodus acutangulus]|uniref:Uncharacterized protein n=1 Tax=Anisodus acutangulus TaxID=402998 RepID=A0A9Q1LEF7_9SOLA|nr:hypothetical protein K7X08_016090 [Anisodus acutangulus]
MDKNHGKFIDGKPINENVAEDVVQKQNKFDALTEGNESHNNKNDKVVGVPKNSSKDVTNKKAFEAISNVVVNGEINKEQASTKEIRDNADMGSNKDIHMNTVEQVHKDH